MALLLFGSFFTLVIIGLPVSVCLGISSIITIVIYHYPMAILGGIVYSGIGKFTLLAIPFFVLAGVIMDYAGISKRLIRFAAVMVGHLKGGLAIVTVIVSAFFAAISGSGPATVAALGPTLIPAMEKAGYKRDWAAALVANAGNMGIIIPPSIIMVIYGVLSETSITKMFMAGIVPGLLFGLALIFTALWSLGKEKEIKKADKAPLKERLSACKDAFWGLMTPVIILGGIYGGVVTPTEAAGIAVVYGLFVGIFIYKEIKLKDMWNIMVDASVSSASVMFIVANASLFAWLLTSSQLATSMAQSLMSISSNKIVLILAMNVILIVAGCFIDSASALYIFVPMLLPVCKQLGIDPVVFGIFVTVNLAVGMSTPPVGVDLFVACNVANVKLNDISRQTIKFVLASIVVLLLASFFPQISLFLPRILGL